MELNVPLACSFTRRVMAAGYVSPVPRGLSIPHPLASVATTFTASLDRRERDGQCIFGPGNAAMEREGSA